MSSDSICSCSFMQRREVDFRVHLAEYWTFMLLSLSFCSRNHCPAPCRVCPNKQAFVSHKKKKKVLLAFQRVISQLSRGEWTDLQLESVQRGSECRLSASAHLCSMNVGSLLASCLSCVEPLCSWSRTEARCDDTRAEFDSTFKSSCDLCGSSSRPTF